jgi:hypothetical protein
MNEELAEATEFKKKNKKGAKRIAIEQGDNDGPRKRIYMEKRYCKDI